MDIKEILLKYNFKINRSKEMGCNEYRGELKRSFSILYLLIGKYNK